jgi:hypothetical protein
MRVVSYVEGLVMFVLRPVLVDVDSVIPLPDVAFLDPTHDLPEPLREAGEDACLTLLPRAFRETDHSVSVGVDLHLEVDILGHCSSFLLPHHRDHELLESGLLVHHPTHQGFRIELQDTCMSLQQTRFVTNLPSVLL